jgi:hypothetical protein
MLRWTVVRQPGRALNLTDRRPALRNHRQRARMAGRHPGQRLITVAKAVGLSEPVPRWRNRSMPAAMSS